MAAYTRKQYSGAARNTTTTTLLTNVGTTVDIAATTGWPSVAGVPFYVVIEPASINEESSLEIKDGQTEVTVLLDDEEICFTMSQKDDILAAALRNDVDAPYSCQGGVCSSCLGKVTQGTAVMIKNSILTDDEVNEGFILTCQAHPTRSKISIDFDDV